MEGDTIALRFPGASDGSPAAGVGVALAIASDASCGATTCALPGADGLCTAMTGACARRGAGGRVFGTTLGGEAARSTGGGGAGGGGISVSVAVNAGASGAASRVESAGHSDHARCSSNDSTSATTSAGRTCHGDCAPPRDAIATEVVSDSASRRAPDFIPRRTGGSAPSSAA